MLTRRGCLLLPQLYSDLFQLPVNLMKMKKIIKPLIFFCAITIIFGRPEHLKAQSDIVQRQVLQIGLLLASEGYELTHDIRYSSLSEGKSNNYYFTLDRGTTYKIYAVCDGDCGDIDLCLFDENGNEIDCDESEDDMPLVSATPKWTGRFRLWVKMYECSINPCRDRKSVV